MGERSNILDTLLQQMEDMELNINQIVEEKGQALLDEKNKSDQLLYSVLPKYGRPAYCAEVRIAWNEEGFFC